MDQGTGSRGARAGRGPSCHACTGRSLPQSLSFPTCKTGDKSPPGGIARGSSELRLVSLVDVLEPHGCHCSQEGDRAMGKIPVI